jgi:DNA-binding NarL/FixJ family response regulator
MVSEASFIAGARTLREPGAVALRCLIVDDNEEFLVSASALLSTQGLHIVGTAATGVEAIRQAGALRPDVVLVDLQLGDEDGLELARHLAGTIPTTRVVLISAHPKDDLTELVAGSPAAAFLAKAALSADAIARLVV